MAKLVDAAGRPHSGVVPYPVVALVVDNDDPEELGRVQVKFPTLHEEPISFWLRQISPNAGKERGQYALPEVDDEVMVLFMNGTQDIGVIVGQFWNGKDVPPKEAIGGLDSVSRTMWKGKWSKDGYAAGSSDDADNDRRFWRSRSGHIIGFDDTKGKETVQVWDKSGQLGLIMDSKDGRIILSNNKGDIHIRTAKNLFFEAGMDAKFKVGKNYEFEAGMNTKFKAGMNHEFKAGMNAKHDAGMNYDIKAGLGFKAKAGLTAKIEGGLTFNAKGGLQAEMKGGLMAVVKGAFVMIN